MLYPKYYNVDDIPVVLMRKGNDIVAICANSKPTSIGRTIVNGFLITESEYNRLAKRIYGNNMEVIDKNEKNS